MYFEEFVKVRTHVCESKCCHTSNILNKLPCTFAYQEGIWDSGGQTPCILYLSPIWRWTPSFFGLGQFTAGERAPQITAKEAGWTAQFFWMFYIEKSNSSLDAQVRYPLTAFSVKSVVTVQKPRVSKISISRHSAIVTLITSLPLLMQRKLNI